VSKEIRALIFRMVAENPTWGAPRIHGELLKLGFDLSEITVSRWLRRAPRTPDPAERWLTFLRNHREAIAAMDFFTVPTLTFGGWHLKRLMSEYVRYYHEDRTHLGLAKDTPTGQPTATCPAGKQDSLLPSTGRIAPSLRHRGLNSETLPIRLNSYCPNQNRAGDASVAGPSPWLGVTSLRSNESGISGLHKEALANA
jgi:hypothetical protein